MKCVVLWTVLCLWLAGGEATCPRPSASARVRRLVDRLTPPVGFLGFDDIACRHIAYACEERGLRVPDDVATSERTLQRRFRKRLGHSVIHEIIRQRIRHARQLLIDGDKLVKRIARDCGFKDSRRFGLAFLKLEGMSPTKYRLQHRV